MAHLWFGQAGLSTPYGSCEDGDKTKHVYLEVHRKSREAAYGREELKPIFSKFLVLVKAPHEVRASGCVEWSSLQTNRSRIRPVECHLHKQDMLGMFNPSFSSPGDLF